MSNRIRLLRWLLTAALALAIAQPAAAFRGAGGALPCGDHAAHRADGAGQADEGLHGAGAAHPGADPAGGDRSGGNHAGAGCGDLTPAAPCAAADCAGSCSALPAVVAALPAGVADRFVAPALPPGRLGLATPPETPPPIA